MKKLLRRTVGFIPQNPFIFNQSLRENLLVAVPSGRDESDSALMQAVELAQLDPLIESRRAQGGLDASAGYMGMGALGGRTPARRPGTAAAAGPASHRPATNTRPISM